MSINDLVTRSRNMIARAEIKLLLKHYPFQVRDVLNEQGKHFHTNPRKRKASVHSLPPVDIVTSDGLTEEQAGHDFGRQMP